MEDPKISIFLCEYFNSEIFKIFSHLHPLIVWWQQRKHEFVLIYANLLDDAID